MKEALKYVIIGNSAAGLNGAEAIRSRDAKAEITIISEEDYPAYSRCLIPYFMEGKISEDDMLYRPRDYYKKNKFKPMLGSRVDSIDTKAQKVKLNKGDDTPYDSLLIATGGSPKLPDTPGMDKKGVFGFRTTKDMQDILKIAKNAKQALVMGGGCIGLMAASGLHSQGLKVSIVIRSPHLLSQVADPEAGKIFRKVFAANGLPVFTEADVVKVSGGENVEAVELNNGKKLEVQLIVVGKGVKPNLGLVKDTDIKTDYGIVVDEQLKTSVKNVYAAGDVAQTTDIVTGESTVNAIWPAAAQQGRIAGANMSGEHQKYEGSMRMNSAEFFGVPLISIGNVKPKKPENYEILSRLYEDKNIFRKVVLRENVLVGAVLVGQIENAGVYNSLMTKKVDVSSIKNKLLSSHFNFTSILSLIGKEKAKFTEPEYREAMLDVAE